MPLGLVTLLKFGGASLVNQTDEQGIAPFSYTIRQLLLPGRDSTDPQPYSYAPKTEFLVAFKLLLAAGAAISDSADATEDMMVLLAHLLSSGDRGTAHVLLETLVFRRRRLQLLAETWLSWPFCNTVGKTQDSVLDAQACKVMAALLHAGAEFPMACSVPKSQAAIYHCLSLLDSQATA